MKVPERRNQMSPGTVSVVVPAGPYPDCLMVRTALRKDSATVGVVCEGKLLPMVEPAKVRVEQSIIAGPGAHNAYETWWSGTVVMYWKCSSCGREVR